MRGTHRTTRILLATLLSLGLLLLVASGTAFAHAKVLSATPGIGSTIATAPTTVTVTAAENINPDPRLSNLFVYGPSGDLVSKGDAKVSLNNPTQMSIAITPEKAPGVYIVRWITVSALDGDPDQGAFIFTVKPGAAAAAAPAAAPTAAASTTPAQATSNAGNGFPVLPVVIIAIVALLVGLGAGLGIGRARRPAQAAGVTAGTSQRQEHEKTTTKQSN